ncbi:GNAT family N-acetyltransferase [Bdellovibrio sp. HCB337]|uniref:GNAT family N-acetyltransferase n=1 Tax=Bdellovibrio sp. HCB337 TaxID=3394358 RepID=UPI0039A66E49
MFDNGGEIVADFRDMLKSLEVKPFEKSLRGPRVYLTRASSLLTDSLWESILVDRELRPQIWPWVENKTQIQDYMNEVDSELPGKEVVYLIGMSDSPVIGAVHIHSINHGDHKAELGYWIQKKFEGFGFVSESLNLVEKELSRLKFNKMEIRCNSDNVRSVRLALKNGFRLEGTLVQDCIEDGRYRDTMVFGKLLQK